MSPGSSSGQRGWLLVGTRLARLLPHLLPGSPRALFGLERCTMPARSAMFPRGCDVGGGAGSACTLPSTVPGCLPVPAQTHPQSRAQHLVEVKLKGSIFQLLRC